MHPALQIDEIIRTFTEYTVFDDLLSLALTCGAFYEPAMDRRWRRCALKWVVVCLPEEVLGTMEVDDCEITTITRCPSLEQWARFQHHARRVTELLMFGTEDTVDMRGRPDRSIHDICYIILRRCYPEPCIFPRLRSIVNAYTHFNQCLDLFVHSSLRELHGEVRTKDDIAVYASLCANAPALEVLDITYPYWVDLSPSEQTDLNRALRSLNHLRELDIKQALYRDTLQHLATLCHLTKLCFVIDDSNYMPLASNTPAELFPSLETLVIWELHDDHSAHSNIPCWLHGILPTPLRAVEISSRRPLSPESAETLFSTFASCSALEWVHVQFSLDDVDDTVKTDYVVRGEAFLPLLDRLRNIQHFYLRDVPVDWSRALFRKIAPSWRNLTYLILYGAFWTEMSPIQVADLLPFVQFCPALRVLDILVSPHMPEYVSADMEYPHTATSNLQSLSLGTVVIEPESIPHVASFLSRFFPSVVLKKPRLRGANRELDKALARCIDEINSLRRHA